MVNRLPIVGVMGARDIEHADFSVPVGRMIAEMGLNLLTGGGNGVMLKTSEAFVSVPDRKGVCIGIIPSEPDDSGQYIPRPGYPNKFVEIPIFTPLSIPDFQQPEKINRNHINALTPDAVIALPGNSGTRDEIRLSIKFGKPIMLFCPQGYYDDIDKSVPRTDRIEDVRAFIKSKLS